MVEHLTARRGLWRARCLDNGHAGFGRRSGKTHQRQRWQGVPDRSHTYRFWKQTLGWTRPKLRAAQAADRWTWLLVIAHTQLRLGRHLIEDLRHPWERPVPRGQLTPARVRRGFRNPPPAPRPTGWRTQTLQTWPGAPTRHPQPPARAPLRRRQDRQTRPHPRSATTIRTMKKKSGV
ncbi:hypothetical protein GCM10023334_040270 [Nonomuraea thailandensis]